MNPTPHVLESALLLLATFLLGCVVGFLLRRLLQKPQPAGVSEPVAEVVEAAPGSEAAVSAESVSPEIHVDPAGETPAPDPAASSSQLDGPELLDAPRDGRKDDLKKIKGLGPKMEAALNEIGVFHFDQIAGWNRKAVRSIDEQLSLRGRIEREKWVSQAKAIVKAKS